MQSFLSTRPYRSPYFLFTEAENTLNLPDQAHIQANAKEFGIPLVTLDAAEPGDIRLPEGVKAEKPPKNRVENEIPSRTLCLTTNVVKSLEGT